MLYVDYRDVERHHLQNSIPSLKYLILLRPRLQHFSHIYIICICFDASILTHRCNIYLVNCANGQSINWFNAINWNTSGANTRLSISHIVDGELCSNEHICVDVLCTYKLQMSVLIVGWNFCKIDGEKSHHTYTCIYI